MLETNVQMQLKDNLFILSCVFDILGYILLKSSNLALESKNEIIVIGFVVTLGDVNVKDLQKWMNIYV